MAPRAEQVVKMMLLMYLKNKSGQKKRMVRKRSTESEKPKRSDVSTY